MNSFDDLLNGVYSSTCSEVSVLAREVRVQIGVLTKTVIIRIYYNPKRAEPYSFEMSQVMKTPGREVREASRTATTENEALRRALRLLSEDYEDAVRRGQLPDETWLVPAEPVR